MSKQRIFQHNFGKTSIVIKLNRYTFKIFNFLVSVTLTYSFRGIFEKWNISSRFIVIYLSFLFIYFFSH